MLVVIYASTKIRLEATGRSVAAATLQEPLAFHDNHLQLRQRCVRLECDAVAEGRHCSVLAGSLRNAVEQPDSLEAGTW